MERRTDTEDDGAGSQPIPNCDRIAIEAGVSFRRLRLEAQGRTEPSPGGSFSSSPLPHDGTSCGCRDAPAVAYQPERPASPWRHPIPKARDAGILSTRYKPSGATRVH